jgi:hypothetical protein
VGSTTVDCSATDRANNTRTRSFTVTVVANAAASVPTATNGATVVVEATGFLPGSLVFVRFQSDPVYVGVFTADAEGKVVLELTVPDNLPPGSHDVIVEGFGKNGGVWQYVQPIEVSAEGPGVVVPADPPVMPVTPAAPSTGAILPGTGGDGGLMPIAPIGLGAIALGLALVATTRRRSG